MRSCKLCEWRCGVDRLAGERGVCGSTLPLVASSQLHPAPPSSFDAFMTGCNFRCIFCQNWPISMYDETATPAGADIEGYYAPAGWAELGLAVLGSAQAVRAGADRLFFTGGEPTCSLPWVEEVVRSARALVPGTKVNYDTNGFLTRSSLDRVLGFATSITYDLKGFDPAIFRALTGGDVKPVLRNLKYLIKHAPDKIWEVRVMVIPGVHDADVEGICNFLADIDPNVKLNFLAFRPKFVMEKYFGATRDFLGHCVSTARGLGLSRVSWSGVPGINGILPKTVKKIMDKLDMPNDAALPLAFAKACGCTQENRNCGACKEKHDCDVKRYVPKE